LLGVLGYSSPDGEQAHGVLPVTSEGGGLRSRRAHDWTRPQDCQGNQSPCEVGARGSRVRQGAVLIRRALIQRRYGDRPQLLHKVPTDLEEEAGKVQSPFITDGMTRSSAQLSWHFMKLLHDAERGTLVIVHRGLHDLIGPYLITPMIGEPVTGWWGRRQ